MKVQIFTVHDDVSCGYPLQFALVDFLAPKWGDFLYNCWLYCSIYYVTI